MFKLKWSFYYYSQGPPINIITNTSYDKINPISPLKLYYKVELSFAVPRIAI